MLREKSRVHSNRSCSYTGETAESASAIHTETIRIHPGNSQSRAMKAFRVPTGQRLQLPFLRWNEILILIRQAFTLPAGRRRPTAFEPERTFGAARTALRP